LRAAPAVTQRFCHSPPRSLTTRRGAVPQVVHEMVARYGVGEFHLSFAQGLWLNDRWGHAPVPAPHGAQLHAWFAPEEALAGAPGPPGAPVGLGARWRGLTNALAGLFGASINVLEADTRHAHPRRALRPASSWLRAAWGSDAGGDAPASHLFVGSLPRETACTENFTPWAKLLPCRARAGLAALMRPARCARAPPAPAPPAPAPPTPAPPARHLPLSRRTGHPLTSLWAQAVRGAVHSLHRARERGMRGRGRGRGVRGRGAGAGARAHAVFSVQR
jgi:hypothetical protein